MKNKVKSCISFSHPSTCPFVWVWKNQFGGIDNRCAHKERISDFMPCIINRVDFFDAYDGEKVKCPIGIKRGDF